MKILAALLGLLVSAHCALAAPEESAVEPALRAQAAAWDAAICRKDEAAIVANLGAGFRHVDGDGHLSTQAQFVGDLLDPELRIDPYTVEHLEVQLLGDTALLTGETHLTGAYRQKPFKSHYRYVDVYRRREGRWAVVYIQITRLPD